MRPTPPAILPWRSRLALIPLVWPCGLHVTQIDDMIRQEAVRATAVSFLPSCRRFACASPRRHLGAVVPTLAVGSNCAHPASFFRTFTTTAAAVGGTASRRGPVDTWCELKVTSFLSIGIGRPAHSVARPGIITLRLGGRGDGSHLVNCVVHCKPLSVALSTRSGWPSGRGIPPVMPHSAIKFPAGRMCGNAKPMQSAIL